MDHICMLHTECSDRCFRVSYVSIAPNELHSLARPARGKGKERGPDLPSLSHKKPKRKVYKHWNSIMQ